MKIRTQLLLGAALFGAVLLVIAASVAITTAELDRIEGQATLTGRIVTATNELDYIANEYLLYGEPKQLDYWSGRYAALSADIANLSADSPEQQALVRAIADDQQRLQAVFDGIVASSGSGSPASADQGAFQVAWSRVGVQSQALVYDASRLSALLEDEADGLRFRNSLLIVALLGAFVLLLLVGFAVVGGRTLRSVNALQAGADAIGAGDLGHRIDASSDDEVGDLARSFNRMAGDLATVTASRAELEAAQAELRSVALFPLQNPHPVLRADRDGRLLFSNPAGAALLGNLRVGRPLPEPLCRVTREACAGGTRRTTEQGFGPTTYAIAVVPLPELGYVNLYFADVTERKAAEAALRERERTLQSVFRAAPVGIGISSDRTLRSVNASFCAMTGYAEDELLGQPTRLLYPDDEEYDRVGREKYGQIVEAGIGVVETRWQRKDGAVIEVLLSASPMDHSSPYENVVTIALDLTPLAEKEAALRASEARYRELVEQAGSIILRYDRDGRLTFVNEFAQRFFGFSAGELLGRTAIGTIIPETESSTGRDLAGMVREIVQSPRDYAENENENITKDGRRVWVRWANRPIVGPDGEVREFLAIGTDITRRRAVEAALAVSEEKYRHLFMHDITGDFIAAADGRILDCNPAFARMFGFASVEEALSSNIAETYTTPEDRPALLDRVRHEGMVQYDARFRRRVDGSDIHVVENILGRFDDDGALVETQGYIIEDTERYRAEEELRQSYEWFRVMGEALPYGVWRCNPRGGAEYTSQSFLDLLEMTEDEMREFGWTHRLPPDEVAPMLERWMHCVETGEDWDDEHHVLGPDGVYHTVLTRGRPVRDRDGAIVAWVGINLDIDERKRAEEALAESEANMARAQSTAHLGNWAWDLATNVISCSDEHCRLYGLAPGDYPIETFIDLVHEDDRQPIRDAIAATLNEGRPYDVECRVVRPDGVERVLHGEGEALRDQDGRVTGMFGIAQDITERKAAEMALAADLDALTRMHALSGRQVEREGLEPLLQEIMETAVAIMGAEKGTLQLAEGGSLRIAASFGHDEPFLTFFAAAEARASACGLAMAQRDRVVVPDVEVSPVFLGTGSLAVLRAAGVRAVQSTPLLSRAGELVGVLTTQWAVPYEPDEHDLWRLDLLARQAADLIEHARAVDALRAYAEDLRRSNEDLERYAYVSSHDLQEPLRSIVSFAQLLERKYRGKLGQDADDYIAFIVEGGNRMQTLILDLLAYSRVNSTAQERRPTDVEAVIAAVERHLDLQLREAAATVTHDPMPTVTADPLQLEQVFENLVSNAVKFRRPDVPLRIHVGARRMDGSWEFSVRDNGIGIEPEYFDRIFVIFQRLHTKEAYPGTGIGLAIVKRIIDRHGGRIRVESTPGEGTTFFFTLPAA